MTNAAIVSPDGVVLNIAVGEPEPPEGAVIVTLQPGQRVAKGWIYDGEALLPPEEPVVAPTGDDLKAHAARRRWVLEVGGINVDGVSVPTSDRAKTMISSAAQILEDGETIAFKADSGFVTVSGAQVQVMRDAIAAHVQRLFSAERALHDAIDAGDITGFDEIDVELAAAVSGQD